jgi:hypothetical protein
MNSNTSTSHQTAQQLLRNQESNPPQRLPTRTPHPLLQPSRSAPQRSHNAVPAGQYQLRALALEDLRHDGRRDGLGFERQFVPPGPG